MKIRLTNKTAYRDDDLRAIIKAACAAAGVSSMAREILCTIKPGKLHVRGRATLPRERRLLLSGVFRLVIPRFEIWGPGRHGERERTPEQLKIEVCQVALHEAMHLAGVRHKDMTEDQHFCCMPVPWATDLHLRTQETPAAVPREERMAAARGDRLEHAQAMLTKAETRQKRAATILKKWKRRVGALSR